LRREEHRNTQGIIADAAPWHSVRRASTKKMAVKAKSAYGLMMIFRARFRRSLCVESEEDLSILPRACES
jgi:hypothetical protein